MGKEFSAAIHFDHARFHGETIIRNNSFQLASFANSRFKGKKIDFSCNAFKGPKTDFSKAELYGNDILISNVQFEGEQVLEFQKVCMIDLLT
jgi:hypothetical protein